MGTHFSTCKVLGWLNLLGGEVEDLQTEDRHCALPRLAFIVFGGFLTNVQALQAVLLQKVVARHIKLL